MNFFPSVHNLRLLKFAFRPVDSSLQQCPWQLFSSFSPRLPFHPFIRVRAKRRTHKSLKRVERWVSAELNENDDHAQAREENSMLE